MTEERWDFYPCRVDEAPASMLVAFHFEDEPPPPDCDTLHVVGIGMSEPDEHGMGSQAEAEILWPAEDALVAVLAGERFLHVGRLRNRGVWQVSFYGPSASTDTFLRAVDKHSRELGREAWTHVDGDADWSYYRSFLLPDVERRKRISDRIVVDRLIEHGDRLVKARTVDHELEFPSREAAELFLDASLLRGYQRKRLADEAGPG